MSDRKVAIVGRVDPGVSAVFQVIVYDALDVRQLDASVRRLASPTSVVLHCAVYSTDLLENGWEPFEQPSACAYVPLAYSDLTERTLSRFGAVLIDPCPRRGEFQTLVAEGDSSRVAFLELDRVGVHNALSAICRRIGLTPQDTTETVNAIEEPVALAAKAA